VNPVSPGTPAAVRAWMAFAPDGGPPVQVEQLGSKIKSAVYRLHAVGPGGTVIAKWTNARGVAEIALTMQQQVLARLDGPYLRVLGVAQEPDGAWLFLEDGGDLILDPERASDLTLAIRWLAGLHAAEIARPAGMPDRELTTYRETLTQTCVAFPRVLEHSGLGASERETIERLARRLGMIAREWERLEPSISVLPSGIVHGDFVPNNLRVLKRHGSRFLGVLDWETSGWGTTAPDVGHLYSWGGRAVLEEFRSALGAGAPPLARLEAFARAGVVLNTLNAVAWTLPFFAYPWIDASVVNLGHYDAVLAGSW
jgi:Ser/Thr protein kinase RdoA (MazF antagonist)